MTRKITTLLLLGALATPLSAAAQDGSSRRGGSAGEEADVFTSALREISQRHKDFPTDSALWHAALQGMVDALDDPYAAVWTPEQVAAFEEDNTGNYAGIGVQITQLNDVITVTAVFRSTPADRAGMQVGDVIVGVDEHDATDWTTAMASDSIRGLPGTDVRVTIRRDGMARPIPLTITRDEVHVPAVREDRIAGTIGYVAVDRVARNSAREVDQAIRELGDVSGLVLDLRRNPGGYLDESLLMADIFLEPGAELASLRSRAVGQPSGTEDESWNARIPARIPDVPIVVLVDEFTASAAEIVAGALQDHDRAVVIGQRTFGKGVVQTVRPLPHGYQLRITTGTWHTPLGRSLHRARSSEGRPVAENLDTFPRVRTAQGRSLIAAGGVFPDLALADDTLRTAERDLLEAAAAAEVNIPLRLAEFGFEEARALTEAGEEPRLRGGAFDRFVDGLAAEGVPAEALANPVARDYLAWRARVTIADRMDDFGAASEFRMERDPVLTRAVDLLRSSPSQADLLATARAAGGSPDQSGAPPR